MNSKKPPVHSPISKTQIEPLQIITRYTGRLIGGFIVVLACSIIAMTLGTPNVRLIAIFTCFGYIVCLIVSFWAARKAEEEMLVYTVQSKTPYKVEPQSSSGGGAVNMVVAQKPEEPI